ncbi:MAG: LysR family transcriptional regulator [Rhodobacteraceae bacterium]|nr:LysR family transcriptional regulator [Paracoccaceae bacterium]
MPKKESITLKQLRALASVSEYGTITAAAETLGLTPPAVHTQLRGLETAIGSKVLTSSGSSGAVLTAEGEALLSTALQIDSVLDSCLDKVRALRDGQSGVAVLGVVSTGKYFAPGLVVRLREAYPDIDVILKVGNRDKIISDLKQGAIELAIMGRPPRSPANTSYEIGPHPHVIVAPATHRLAQIDNISPADLLSETFISRELGSGTRILMMRYLDRAGEGMTYRQIEMGSNETIKQAVIAGLGIAMISQHTVTDELNSGRLVTLNVPGLPILRHWYLLHRTDLRMTPTLETVRDFILDLDASFLPRLSGESA